MFAIKKKRKNKNNTLLVYEQTLWAPIFTMGYDFLLLLFASCSLVLLCGSAHDQTNTRRSQKFMREKKKSFRRKHRLVFRLRNASVQ